MARVALPSGLASALTKQRGPLRAYQWLWMLLCLVGALAAAAPRILSRPVIYTSATEVQVDLGRSYARIVTNGPSDPDFDAVRRIALTLLRVKEQGGRPLYPGVGDPAESPRLNVRFEPRPDGSVLISATASSAAEAQALADDAAEALARSIRAAGGREIFRNLMGWEQYAAFAGAPPRGQFQALLRQVALTSAFELNRDVDIITEPFTVDQLTPADLSDLTRALEVREQELSKIDLAALQARRDGAQGELRVQLDRDVERLRAGLQAIRDAIGYLNDTYDATFRPDEVSAVYRSARARPGELVDRQIAPLLALAGLVGLVFGGVGVAIDRSAGVMAKLRELWGYRALIRNLVLRDLRVRYKGSLLGYLWTQLAPLLLMLVFLFVFSTFMRQGIALFAVFLIAGLLPWNFCAEAVSGGSRSVIDNANLIKKVFFPREVLPLVSVCSSLVNYVLSLPMLFLVIGIAQWLELGRLNFSWTFAYLPILLIIQTLFLTGVVFFTSALAVFFRDFVHLIGILIQFWFFLTPVVYSLDALNVSPAQAQLIRWLNPMASLIDFYHEILYGGVVSAPNVPQPGLPALDSVLRVLITAVVVLAVGYWFFQRRSGRFGEEI